MADVDLPGRDHSQSAGANRPSSAAFADEVTSKKPKPRTSSRPNSVAFFDQPASGTRPTFTPPDNDVKEWRERERSASERPGSVLMIDSQRPATVNEDDGLAAEAEVKARLQNELKAIRKGTANKDLVHLESGLEQEALEAPAARSGTAGPKRKPGTARDIKSRGRSQQKSRGVPGTIGILWKEAYRPVVAPTTADNGYRHVLTVQSIVPGGPAEATGRFRIGDKLIAVQDGGQRNRNVVVGLKKDDIRRALHGDAGLAISLELLRATDMGAKKAFLVNLVRAPKVKDVTKLPQIGNTQQIPSTPSIKQTGWAKGVRLQGNMAPGDGELKEYHSLSEEGDEDGNASMSDDPDGDLEIQHAHLNKMKKLKVSNKLTRKENEQLEVMRKHSEQLNEESANHAAREEYLLTSIRQCEEELMKARELFCDVARRATGNPLDPGKCAHKNHGAVHSLQMCMQDFRPIIDAFLTKIEEAPAFLPPAIAVERAKEEIEAKDTKETARELRDAKAALQDAQEREARRIAEMAAEIESTKDTYSAEKDEIKAKTDEEIAALFLKIEMRDKEIEELKTKCEELRDELDSIVELKDVEEIKLQLLEAEALGDDSDENQLKKVQILKLACRAAGITQDALQEALKDAAVRAQIEVLKKREAELEAEVDKLRASEDVLHEDQKLQRKFKWSVMINISKVDPEDVKSEEKRQTAGQVRDEEIVQAVNDYVEAAPDEVEIFIRNIQDYVNVRFPFLELTEQHKKLILDTFEDLFKEVPLPTEDELKELERQRLEEEAIDYGYEPKEATGRTAGQLRKMISEARAATKAAKDADRKRRESSWDDGSDDEKQPVDSDDSDAVYKSDDPKEEDEDD